MQYPKDPGAPAAGWRSLAPTATEKTLHCQPRVVAIALVCLAIGTAYLAANYGWRHGALFMVGAALGIILYNSRFGFTYAFRVFVSAADGRGIRAQMLMLALATVLFAPILAWRNTTGGAVAPASLAILVGACIFCIGMQLGGG